MVKGREMVIDGTQYFDGIFWEYSTHNTPICICLGNMASGSVCEILFSIWYRRVFKGILQVG